MATASKPCRPIAARDAAGMLRLSGKWEVEELTAQNALCPRLYGPTLDGPRRAAH
jgi:hypothetical protein